MAQTTAYSLVASIASGNPEARFAPDDIVLIVFAAGELNGIAFALDVPLPLLLVAAGVESAIAADEESTANALAMVRMATRQGESVSDI